jgi:DNA (cytosine-5)-methyltransferase 1
VKKIKVSTKSTTKEVGTVAELFAGVGGFRLALEKSGWSTTFSNQWEPSTKAQHASSVYQARFGTEGHSSEDIAKVKSFPQGPDLLVGGFPCQDYSVAKALSSSKGLQGKKGVLWWEIHRLTKLHKPKYLFLENVDRLLKSPSAQRGRDFAVMLRTLGDLGYEIEWRVVNSADYGFSQRRIRVFIIATRMDRATKSSASEKILESGVLARALPLSKDGDFVEVPIDKDVERVSRTFNSESAKSPFLNAGYYKDGLAVTVKVVSKFKGSLKTLRDVLVEDKDVPLEYWIPKIQMKEWEFLKGAKSIKRVHKESGTEYNYAEGKMGFPDSLDKPSRTILTGEGGTSPSRFKHVIQVRGGHRRLLPVELERLNGFPDGWTEFGVDGERMSDNRRAFFMGNALVVGLIARVGKILALDMKQ